MKTKKRERDRTGTESRIAANPKGRTTRKNTYPTCTRFSPFSGVSVGGSFANGGQMFVRACAWCWPGVTAYDAVPWAKHYPITHGICEFHMWLVTLQTLMSKGAA